MTLSFLHHDLVTPDGAIIELSQLDEQRFHIKVVIENISPFFLGFSIEKERVFFNLKSTLAQLGVNAITKEFELSKEHRRGEVSLELVSLSPEGTQPHSNVL